MAGLLSAELPSSDEEDDDYRPEQDKTAEAEDRAEFGGAPAKKQSAKRARPQRGLIPQSAPADEEEGQEEGEADAEEEQGTAAAAAELLAPDNPNDPKVAAKRARTDQLWALLNSRSATASTKPPAVASIPQPAPASSGPRNSVSLAALCRTVDPKQSKSSSDAIWMRALGIKPKAAPGAGPAVTAPPQALGSTSQPAEHAAPATAVGTGGDAADAGPSAGRDEAGDLAPGPSSGSGDPSAPGGASSGSSLSAAAQALAAAREAAALGATRLHNKVTVTETRRFAGKDIQVALQVDRDSKEAQRAAARASGPPVPAGKSGLDAFLSEVEKKRKVSVLDKSKADWQQAKSANATLEEELEAHKRSDKQYLDKVDFLKRAELRQYEQERDQRLQSDVRTRGRV